MKLILFSFLNFILFNTSYAQVLSKWTFESMTLSGTASTSPVLSAGALAANEGALKSGTEFSGSHLSASSWTTPQGNGSTQALSASKWAVNDYFQFKGSTKGYKNITIKFDATGSDTSPKDFKLQYSTDNGSYVDAGTYTVSNDSWGGSPKSISTKTLNLSSISALNDQDFIYIRLVCTTNTSIANGTVGTSGTSRIDNFSIEAESALPVTLGSFTASRSNDAIDLHWKTYAEVNTSHFSVLKSLDGKTFHEIGRVDALGGSPSGRSYTFSDADVISATAYYQLKVTDKDGSWTSSAIIALSDTPIGALDLDIAGYSAGSVSLRVNAPIDGVARLYISDLQGNLVYDQLLSLKRGANVFVLPHNGSTKLWIAGLALGGQRVSKKWLLGSGSIK